MVLPLRESSHVSHQDLSQPTVFALSFSMRYLLAMVTGLQIHVLQYHLVSHEKDKIWVTGSTNAKIRPICQHGELTVYSRVGHPGQDDKHLAQICLRDNNCLACSLCSFPRVADNHDGPETCCLLTPNPDDLVQRPRRPRTIWLPA